MWSFQVWEDTEEWEAAAVVDTAVGWAEVAEDMVEMDTGKEADTVEWVRIQ